MNLSGTIHLLSLAKTPLLGIFNRNIELQAKEGWGNVTYKFKNQEYHADELNKTIYILRANGFDVVLSHDDESGNFEMLVEWMRT
jgi:hypothetical protein